MTPDTGEKRGRGQRGPSKNPAPLAKPYTLPGTDTTEIDAAIALLERVAAALGDVAAGYVGRVTMATDILASGLPEIRRARDLLRDKAPEKFSDPEALLTPGEAARMLGLTIRGLDSNRRAGKIEAVDTPSGPGRLPKRYYTVAAVQAAAARRVANQEAQRQRQLAFLARNREIKAAKQRAAREKKMPRDLDAA